MVEELPTSRHEGSSRTDVSAPSLGRPEKLDLGGTAEILPRIEINDLSIHQIVSPYFSQNSFLIEHIPTRSALVVDPGVGTAKAIKRQLLQSQCNLSYILLTHEHFDHIANLNELRTSNPCAVAATRECSINITDGKRNLSAFLLMGNPYSSLPAEIVLDKEREVLPWPGPALALEATPGHTESSLCIHLPGVLLTGDTMIWNEKSVVNLPGGSRRKLGVSLDRLFGNCPGDTLVLAGHGRVFRLSETRPSIHLGSRSRAHVATPSGQLSEVRDD